ncbi:MAG: hypothetical protein C0463_03385 [Idiomarina sp.]|nr:hypothetical protein [Idiomarina sp.]MCL5051541.1 hypothetical protein [Bacillota bacterium]
MIKSDAQHPNNDAEITRKRNNRRLFIGVFLCFAIPLLGAQIILKMGWYTPGVTNKGELLSPPIEATAEENQLMPQHWRLAYRVPDACDEQCVNGLYVINQTDLALGRDSSRVTPVAIQRSEQVTGLPELSADSRMQYLVLPELHAQLSELPEGSLLIIDPLGFVMMRYDGSSERNQAIQVGRDMLDDLKKLLKMSRVG